MSNKCLQTRYQILRTLGHGGMGSVFLCEDLRLPGKQWAVKEMLCPESLPYGARESFEREVRILAGLRHRNLPMIVDYFHEEGNEYLVMEYVEGRTLHEEVRLRGRVDEIQALRWGLEIARLLDYLHSREPPVIFRDLKPENIIVQENRSLKLIDFGLARHFVEGKSRDTHASGSIGYAPPEQWDEAGQTDARSDLYALGATLFYVLTGQAPSPVYGSNQLSKHRDDLDPELEQLVQRCLEIDPDKRYGSAARVVHELFLLLSRRLPSGDLGLPPPITRLIPRKEGDPARPRLSRPALHQRPISRWPLILLALATLAFVLGALALRLPTSVPSHTPRSQACTQALDLVAQGRPNQAVALLDKQLTQHPDDAEAHILKNNLYARMTGREVVRVPVITSMTGADGVEGYPMLYGFALAQREINTQGGISQHPLVLDVFDDGSDGDRALELAEQIVATPEYLLAIGAFSSQRSLNMALTFDQARMTLLAPTASDPAIWQTSPYLVTVADTNTFRIQALARYLRQQGLSKAGMLVDESLKFSGSCSEIFHKAFQDEGGEVVAVLNFVGSPASFAPQVATLEQRGVDCVFFSDYRASRLALFEQALVEKHLRLPVASQVALFAPGLSACNGLLTASYFHPEAPDPAVRQFVAEYQQSFGLNLPSHVPSGSYDALQLAALALARAGRSRETVHDFLISQPPYHGVTGPFALGRQLELRNAYVVEIRKGRYELISVVKKPTPR